jgi:transcriptional regulator with XRE-family HTH domain
MKRFAEKLRTLRNQRGLTIRQLSDLLDVSFGYVGKMERGERLPNVAMLVKVADLFDVSLDRLIRDELELD